MADNTDQEHLDNQINTQPDNSSDDIILTIGTDTLYKNQETKIMETHAHDLHKAPGHGWKHYVFEFLMLFLAVFCGFLAENQREHMVENIKEIQYIQSLYNDLKKDTLFNNGFKTYLTQIYKRLDSIQNMINSRQYLKDPNSFYFLAFGTLNIKYFESHTSAYEQLKSSGNLRLITSKQLSDSIVDYYSTIQERVKVLESRYVQATDNIHTAMWDVLDTKYYTRDSLTEGKSLIGRPTVKNATMENVDERKLQKYKNLCYDKMVMLPSLRNFTLELSAKATNLLLLLKDEYHIE